MQFSFTPFRLGLVGLLGLLATLAFRWGIINHVVTNMVQKQMVLEPGTPLWKLWTEMPFPIYSTFYLYNVTNPEGVEKGEAPILHEMGPYVYEEKRHKIILSVNHDVVTYRPRTTYFFRPDLSYGREEDNVTLLNVPFVGVAKTAWEISKQPLILSTLDDMLAEKGERLFHTHTVKEYLFEGVSIESYMEILSLPVAQLAKGKVKIPKRLMDGDYGFFDDRNGTAEDVWTVGTGKSGPESFGKVVSFNGLTKADVWKDERCDAFEGTDGTLFPPFLDKSSILNIYHPDLCRGLPMEVASSEEFMGLPTLRFTFAPQVFGKLKLYPENQCYCSDTFEWCDKGGVIPLGPCFAGAPLFFSQPHFFQADPSYQAALKGLANDADYHSFLNVDQDTGIPVKGSIKLQINVELQSYAEMSSFMDVPNLMFPLIWVDQTAHIPEYLLHPLYKLQTLQNVTKIVTAIGFTIFTLVLVISSIWAGKSSEGLEAGKIGKFLCCKIWN